MSVPSNERKVVFKTSGLISIRAFTVFGVSSKPKTESPIGYFGTGLKYAIAVLLRNKQKVQVFIGEHEYVFYEAKVKFRADAFDLIKMKKRKSLLSRWSYYDLPFTTELGKNWELWQALRELESNTRDESGYSYDEPIDYKDVLGKDSTLIVVTGAEFVEAYNDLDMVFLRADMKLIDSSKAIEVYNEPSKYLYFRGLRVEEMSKPSMYTYNILNHVELTEDRTVKWSWTTNDLIRDHVLASCNKPFIRQCVQADADIHLEGTLNYDTYGDTMGQEYKEVMFESRRKGHRVSSRASNIFERYYPEETPDPKDEDIDITLTGKEWLEIQDYIEDLYSHQGGEYIPTFKKFIQCLDDIDKELNPKLTPKKSDSLGNHLHQHDSEIPFA